MKIQISLNKEDLDALIEALEIADVEERFDSLAERLAAAREKLEEYAK